MKRNIAFLLAVVMAFAVLSACGAGNKNAGPADTGAVAKEDSSGSADTSDSSAGKWPDYLNLQDGDAYLPIVKEGMGNDITLTLAIVQPVNGSDWKDLWIGKFYEKYMNVHFKVEQIIETGLAERKNLMFASNDLPDVMMNMGLSPNEIMKYGVMDGQLMDLEPYIDPELTPDLRYWYDNRADIRGATTTPDGKIYTLGGVGDPKDEAAGCRVFTDQRWLDACGLELPKTLDEFLNMLRAYKDADVNGVGKENVVPMAAGFNFLNVEYFILNAYGYLTNNYVNNRGYSPAIRNNEAVIPANDTKIYREVLKTIKTMFDEGLLYQNYFMAPEDGVEVNAVVLDKRAGVYGQPIYVIGYDDWKYWVGLHPLTSSWNDTPKWHTQDATSIGHFALSAKNKYPELCMRFVNSYYRRNGMGRFLWVGPRNGSEEAMGVAGVKWYDDLNDYEFVEAEWPEGVNDLWTYLMVVQGPMPGFGATGNTLDIQIAYKENYVLSPPQPNEKTFNLENPDWFYRASLYENSAPYFTTNFPGIYYLDEDTVIKMDDLVAVIKPYVDEQFSAFITGRRPMEEIDAFHEELKGMGIDELEGIYKQIWANYQGSN